MFGLTGFISRRTLPINPLRLFEIRPPCCISHARLAVSARRIWVAMHKRCAGAGSIWRSHDPTRHVQIRRYAAAGPSTLCRVVSSGQRHPGPSGRPGVDFSAGRSIASGPVRPGLGRIEQRRLRPLAGGTGRGRGNRGRSGGRALHPRPRYPLARRDAQNILDAHGHPDIIMAGDWAERVRTRAAKAAGEAMSRLQPCTHLSLGQARVDRIASNRRVMGADGKVAAVRWTKNARSGGARRARGRDRPHAQDDRLLPSGYAACPHSLLCHTSNQQGRHRAGDARIRRPGAQPPHGKKVGCRTYTSPVAGAMSPRASTTTAWPTTVNCSPGRIHRAMVEAEQGSTRQPLERIRWTVEPVRLPPREDLVEEDLLAEIASSAPGAKGHSKAALMVTYLRRRERPIPVTCMHINDGVAVVNLPGEIFIEYQLHARRAVLTPLSPWPDTEIWAPVTSLWRHPLPRADTSRWTPSCPGSRKKSFAPPSIRSSGRPVEPRHREKHRMRNLQTRNMDRQDDPG